ncbi:MAG: OmpA family protein [Campylobacterales bacterium]|nr:OmpA family protein [Campylobacterales bacterium]
MMYKMTFSAVLAGFLLIGCAGTETGTGTGLSKTQTGAILGGLVGAAAGGATGDHSAKRILIGGALGAAAGGGIGYYMDKQQEELNKELAGSGVEVERQGDTINLNMPGGITFDTGKANIKPNFIPVIDDIANVMVKYPETKIEVQGHTDSVGSDASNLTLSQLRAQSVSSALMQRGVGSDRIRSVGYGETMPVASNDTAAGREANRRVEIKIIPNPSK